MIKVLTVGVFDLLHYGHVKLFERAKDLGEYLIVAVQTDENVKIYKPNAEIIYNTKQRTEMVSSIKYVDKVINYETVDNIVKKVEYDILVIGEDQKHEGFQAAIQYSENMNKKVIVLHRTRDVSSSELKNKIERVFW